MWLRTQSGDPAAVLSITQACPFCFSSSVKPSKYFSPWANRREVHLKLIFKLHFTEIPALSSVTDFAQKISPITGKFTQWCALFNSNLTIITCLKQKKKLKFVLSKVRKTQLPCTMMGLEPPEHCTGYFRPILTHSSPKKLETPTSSIWENQNILV